MYKEDTIAAVATPAGEGGVAIVRLSGPEAENIAHRIFVRSSGGSGVLHTHTLHHGFVQDPRSGKAIDEVLLALMRKPHSYTGEDVVEVHCHGGPFLVRRILQQMLYCGARQAEAGEFTKRRYFNGLIDLAQAEAVLDLVRARTEKAADRALNQVQGELSKWVGVLRENLLNIFVQLEGTIDFPEEELELLSRNELLNKIESLNLNIANIISSYEWGKILRDGVRVCIAGQPNVGKSSLLNALLGEKRVIVTAEPGTTRDYIEESLNLDGLPLVLWDTAGIRPTDSYLEKVGIDMTLARLKEAHGVILVLDGSSSITDEDWSILSKIKGEDKKTIIVINKIDLCQKIDIENLKNVIPNNRIVNVSCKNNTGLDDLKISLRALFVNDINNHEIVLTNLRHKTALERANLNLTEVANGLRNYLPPELVAVDLQAAQQALEEIVGIVSNDELIDRIFNQFCIGK